mmetsp:Transcript_3381/g.10863  ORF Transcript_3381/g.10863 Transcript_3381/m.10863 type:complete len:206 (+) Transcript_3381:428-1045(+)
MSSATQCASPQATSFMRHSFSAMMRMGRPLHQRSGPAPPQRRPQVLQQEVPVALPRGGPVAASPAPPPQGGRVVGTPTPSCPWWLEPNAKMVPRRTSCSSAVTPSSGAGSERRARAAAPSSPGFAAAVPGTARPSDAKLRTSLRLHQAQKAPPAHTQASLARSSNPSSRCPKRALRPRVGDRSASRLSALGSAGGPQAKGLPWPW